MNLRGEPKENVIKDACPHCQKEITIRMPVCQSIMHSKGVLGWVIYGVVFWFSMLLTALLGIDEIFVLWALIALWAAIPIAILTLARIIKGRSRR